jgi:hypothetical protein
MGWRDFQMPQDIKEVVYQDSHPVQKDQKVQKENAEELLNGHFVHIAPSSDIENGRANVTELGKSVEEAAHLYRERGWVMIYSTLLDTNIYLVRDEKVKTPDTRILRYAQSELDDLRGLSTDELKLMHEAKRTFGGLISKAE